MLRPACGSVGPCSTPSCLSLADSSGKSGAEGSKAWIQTKLLYRFRMISNCRTSLQMQTGTYMCGAPCDLLPPPPPRKTSDGRTPRYPTSLSWPERPGGGGGGLRSIFCPALPELQLNLQCCLLYHAQRSSFRPASTDLRAKGSLGRSPAPDKLFPPCGLHALPVALTVSTAPPTRDSPHVAIGGGRGGSECLFFSTERRPWYH